jgi:hypothetical protein
VISHSASLRRIFVTLAVIVALLPAGSWAKCGGGNHATHATNGASAKFNRAATMDSSSSGNATITTSSGQPAGTFQYVKNNSEFLGNSANGGGGHPHH